MTRMTAARRKLLRDAAREADALRSDWREGLSHHQLRIEAQFRELASRLKAVPSGRQPKGLPTAKQAKTILEALDRARLKPAKGRAKDLRKVEDTVAAALARLPPQE